MASFPTHNSGRYTHLAKDTLILQPPDRLFVGLSIIPIVNPRPARILLALGSAASAPIALKSSYTCCNLSLFLLLPLSDSCTSFFSSSSNSVLFTSAFRTASLADVSSAVTSGNEITTKTCYWKNLAVIFKLSHPKNLLNNLSITFSIVSVRWHAVFGSNVFLHKMP